MRGLYWSSYVYVAKPWTEQQWVYYGNALTLALCFFGPIAGLLQRWTHRYKTIQLVGLCLKIIGMGILLDGHRATDNTAAMSIAMVLIGAGGAMSVVGSRVASQASVPHQDVALAISLLSLWSKIGSAIGSAIVAVIWSSQMPMQLREHLPKTVTNKDVTKYFGNIRSIRTLPFDSPIRQGAIEAYRQTLYYCIAPALGLAFIPLIAACFQTDYYLGKKQNAVTNVGNDGLAVVDEEVHNAQENRPATRKEAFLKFWAGR